MKRSKARPRRTASRPTNLLGFRPMVEAFERRQLLASTNFLQGAVLDTAHNPIPGAVVTLYSLPGGTPVGTPATTGSNGAYAFSGLAPGNYELVETPPAGFKNASTADLTGLYKATLGTNAIDVTISDGSSPGQPWLLTPKSTNEVGVYFNQGTNRFAGYVGQFTDLSVNEQDVPYSTNFGSFCVDLNRDLYAPPNTPDKNVPYDVVPLAQGLAATTGASAANAGEIAYLYNHYGVNTNLSPSDAAGLQLAIWQLEYGSVTPTSLASPPAGVTLAGVIAAETKFLGLASGQNENAYYLNGLGDAEYPSGAQGVLATEIYTFVDAPKATPTITTSQQPASATVGLPIADTATITGGNGPTGTVTFNLYGNATGTGTPLFTDANEPLSAGGVATSKGYTATATGTDYWVATYNGDANNVQVTGAAASEPVTVTPASPAIATVAGGPVVVGGGAKLTDTASLTGGYSPAGTITFTLTGPGNTVVDTETVAVTGDSTYTTPSGYLPTAVGTYTWSASYGGDSNNGPASDNGQNETETVVPASPTIVTQAAATSSNVVGTALLTDSATLSGGYNPGGTIAFSLTAPDGTTTPEGSVPVAGDATYASPTPVLATEVGTYTWNAVLQRRREQQPGQR